MKRNIIQPLKVKRKATTLQYLPHMSNPLTTRQVLYASTDVRCLEQSAESHRKQNGDGRGYGRGEKCGGGVVQGQKLLVVLHEEDSGDWLQDGVDELNTLEFHTQSGCDTMFYVVQFYYIVLRERKPAQSDTSLTPIYPSKEETQGTARDWMLLLLQTKERSRVDRDWRRQGGHPKNPQRTWPH